MKNLTITKLKTGDKVIVLAGDDKGKTGEITKITDDNRVVINGINEHKRAKKASAYAEGGIIDFFAPIAISNVAIFDGKKGTRIASQGTGKNKVRIAKTTKKEIA
jgi:large subunit ribosomal protein L24